MGRGDYRELLRGSAITLALCVIAVLVCYIWIDRPVAFFVYHHHIDKFPVFRWLTYPPPELQRWSSLILAVLLVHRAWRPFARWQKVLLVSCVSLIVADEFRIGLGDICGRYWPETWFDHNPSLIGTGTYGFHPFQRKDELGSFPSGHATRILSFATVWLATMPRSRIIVAVLAVPMLVSLVAMNYHFVGDVIAGATVGGIVAAYAMQLVRLRPSPETVSNQ
jgi:PAP2 superfamily.